MTLEFKDYLKKFYEEYENFFIDNNISLLTLKEITKTPFKFLKLEMENGLLNEIRLKYFGVFKVHMGTAKSKLKKLEIDYKKGHIKTSEYERIKTMLTKYIKENDKS